MNNFEEILKSSGGLFEGHTSFKNGLHGGGWVEKGFIIRKPKILDLVTKYQAEQIVEEFEETNLLVGPIVNGAVVGSFVAKHLDREFTITLGKNEEIEFHRMYVPKPQKVILVEDLIFTGTDVKANIKFLKRSGFDVVGVSVWINRQEKIIDGVKVISFLKSPFEFYESDKCPLCLKNIPIKYKNVRE